MRIRSTVYFWSHLVVLRQTLRLTFRIKLIFLIFFLFFLFFLGFLIFWHFNQSTSSCWVSYICVKADKVDWLALPKKQISALLCKPKSNLVSYHIKLLSIHHDKKAKIFMIVGGREKWERIGEVIEVLTT